VLGVSHRSDWFAGVLAEAEANLRRLLRLPDDYAVLFLQGGATQQFSMIPMLLLRASGKTADYLRTGYWSDKAIAPARCEGSVRIAWDGAPSGFRRLPEKDEAALSPQAAYLHYTSNETVDGLQFHGVPGTAGVPLVCDMSSDFLSRPLAPARFDLIYAHAQKNLGPAGVTVVILRRALLENAPPGLPEYFDYRAHAAAGSLYNTPPVFAIYVTLLVTRWLLHDIGGLEKMAAINHTKAALLYRALDESAGFYQGWVAREHRSLMNVVFRLADAELERKFLQAAEAEGFSGLPGHRALGGVRASLYNAMTPEAVEALVAFMAHFRQQHG
jgi:phosphoserine aminotransferase